MKIFTCSNCSQRVYFESHTCGRCQAALGYVDAANAVFSLSSSDSSATFTIPSDESGTVYRRCKNHAECACNWLVPASTDSPYCRSCRLTERFPPLNSAENRAAWTDLEAAKRRLLYSLTTLRLPIDGDETHRAGLRFRFLQSTPQAPVVTGHAQGQITVNIAEANDSYRENERERLGEAYRTTLGHLRHESGHYYFDRLVQNSPQLDAYRKLFGDERTDYQSSLKSYYDKGPPQGFADRHVSAYATMHPWEDWAETFAHYLHMTDTLETAESYGLSVDRPAPHDGKVRASSTTDDFEVLIDHWIPVTLALNGLNRSMGLTDAYPFALSNTVTEKLHFVHRIVVAQRSERG